MIQRVNNIGDRLRALRELRYSETKDERFRTQGNFATAIGVGQSQLSDWENGRYVPDLPNLIKLLRALRVPIGQILPGYDAEYDAMVRDLIRQSGGVLPGEPSTGGILDVAEFARLRAQYNSLRDAIEHLGQLLSESTGAILEQFPRADGPDLSQEDAAHRGRTG